LWGWFFLSFLTGVAARWAFERCDFATIKTTYQQRASIVWTISLIAAGLLFLMAAALDGDWLPRWGLSVYSVLVAPRFVACFIGLSTGIVARQIVSIIGIAQLPTGVVPTAAVVALVAVVLLAFSPRILDSLQSFKAGSIEATFATRSSSVREAEIRLNDIAQKLTLKEYINFEKYVVEKKSDRRTIARWSTPKLETDKRIALLKGVIRNFGNPIVLALTCLDEQDALEAVKRQDHLTRIASAWEHFLIQLNKGPVLRDKDWTTFANEISGQVPSFFSYIDEAGAGCDVKREKPPTEAELKDNLDRLKKDYLASLNSLPEDVRNGPPALTAMEPYVAGLVGDLIAFTFGQKEKAEFLDRIVGENFHLSDNLLQPGIVNLLFQVADSKIQSEVSWPLDRLTSQLDDALRGSDLFIARANQHEEKGEEDADKRSIVATYDTVVFRILTENLALYNQRVLRAEPLSEAHLRRWTAVLSRILAILHAYSKTIGPVEDIPPTQLTSEEIKRWPNVTIEDKFLIDANIGVALSLILREPGQEQSSAPACASARYYLKGAEENLRRLFDEGEINYSEKERLEQFIRLVGYRVGAHCTARL